MVKPHKFERKIAIRSNTHRKKGRAPETKTTMKKKKYCPS